MFQLFVQFGNFLFEFLVELFFVFGFLVLAGCPLLRQVGRDARVHVVIVIVGFGADLDGVAEPIKRLELCENRIVHPRLLLLRLGRNDVRKTWIRQRVAGRRAFACVQLFAGFGVGQCQRSVFRLAREFP